MMSSFARAPLGELSQNAMDQLSRKPEFTARWVEAGASLATKISINTFTESEYPLVSHGRGTPTEIHYRNGSFESPLEQR